MVWSGCLWSGGCRDGDDPFQGELLAQIRAAARRVSGAQTAPLVVTATFTVDLAARTVTKDGDPVRLTPTEW